jgi:threonine dehydratase
MPGLPVCLDDVLRAQEAIGGRLHRTPVFSSATLSQRVGAEVFVKAELFQRTGSFKPRGFLNNLASLTPAERSGGVIGISAGNGGAALAYGAAVEGLDALVVMWQGASEMKIAATRQYGGEVDLVAPGPREAFDRLEDLVASTGRALVHPFDPPTIAGHGTIALELLDDCPGLDLLVVPVGGGGLISGIATVAKARRPDIRVVGVEPVGAATLTEALAAGGPVRIDPNTVADGLNAPVVGPHTYAIAKALVDEVVLLEDAEIEAGMRFLYERAKLACEPAGAASTAALLCGKVRPEAGSRVGVVVSGGNVAAPTASAILAGE